MKKSLYLFTTLMLLAACALPGNRSGNHRQIVNEVGKISYTKSTKLCRPLLFGNQSIANMSKKAGITEVVSVEGDNYILVNCVKVY